MSKQVEIVSQNIFKNDNEESLQINLTNVWISLINRLEKDLLKIR